MPQHISYMFFFMDQEASFEESLSLLYSPTLLRYTGKDFIDAFTFNFYDRLRVLQTCLMTTVGDKIKVLTTNARGESMVKHVNQTTDTFKPLNEISELVDESDEPLVLMQASSHAESSTAVTFTVEAEAGGLYDILLHRLASSGDSSKFFICSHSNRCSAHEEAMELFQQFASLEFYYTEVNKISYNICPSVYKYRISPFDSVRTKMSDSLNRVFEVQEHMGCTFMEELAFMHHENIKAISRQKASQDQKSLPSYMQGKKLAETCKLLEQIKCHSGPTPIKGAGKIVYDESIAYLRGELQRVTDHSYYRFDRDRYLQCLDNFRKGWDYYLSVLEIQIIEMKLMKILDSLTFKYSRQPKFLRVFPDRLTTENVKISQKIKVLDGRLSGESSLTLLKKFDASN